ncbi:MAG: permease-like cell division protein FtsX [Desulfosudaceae bacterium]
MPSIYLKRAVSDIKSNRFLNIITVITISLSVLIVSTFALFLTNANQLLAFWEKGIRIIVYVEDDLEKDQIDILKEEIRQLQGVTNIRFIPKEDGLRRLKEKLPEQQSLLDNLIENPLPDTLEVWVTPEKRNWKAIEMLAIHIESSHLVADVEYGQNWLKRFTGLLNLFRLTVILMCTIFFMAAVFIVANTTRLLFFSRSEEINIMRLVGATDRFIKTPFYLEGLIQGAAGGIIGLAVLYLAFLLIASEVDLNMIAHSFKIRFLPLSSSLAIITGSMIAGWLGCYISLSQFLKK